jgi:hypothetical protein
MALTKVDKSLLETTSGTPDASTFLRGDGTWASAGGGLLGLVVYTGSGTYTVGATTNGTAGNQGSADVSKVIIECQAAGGAGASRGGTGSVYQGGSGGGGAYSKTFRDLTDITSITIVVPTGPPGGSPGAAGGAASLTKASGSGTFATITCDGGSAGGSPAGTTQGASGAGAAVPTTGDINIGGGIGPMGGEGQGGSINNELYRIRTTLRKLSQRKYNRGWFYFIHDEQSSCKFRRNYRLLGWC